MAIQHVNNSGSAADSNVQRLGLGTTEINGKTYRMTAIYSGSPALSEDAKIRIGDLAKDLFREVKTSGVDLSQYKFIKISNDAIHSENAKITDHTEKTTDIFNSIRNEFLHSIPAPSGSLPNPSNVSVLLDPVESLPRRLPPLPKAKEVGKLGADWKFFSDHLPVSAKISEYPSTNDVIKNFSVASWNILNQKDVEFIENGYTSNGVHYSAGLDGSAITTTSRIEREAAILDRIVEMAKTHELIALQEVSTCLLPELEKRLPSMKIIASSGISNKEILLINDKFDCSEFESKRQKGSFQSFVRAKIQNLTSGKEYQVITTRLNGIPGENVASRQELADYIKNIEDDKSHVIVLGDMNCEAKDMFENMSDAGDFIPYNLYNNHIGTDQRAKIFSQIWVKKGEAKQEIHVDAKPASSFLFDPLIETSAAQLN